MVRSTFRLLAIASLAAADATQHACNDGYPLQVTNYLFAGEAIYSTPSHLAVTQAQVNLTILAAFLPTPIFCSSFLVGEWPTYSWGNKWLRCSETDAATAFITLTEPPGLLVVQLNWTSPRYGYVESL
jgi:hypothetical protein